MDVQNEKLEEVVLYVVTLWANEEYITVIQLYSIICSFQVFAQVHGTSDVAYSHASMHVQRQLHMLHQQFKIQQYFSLASVLSTAVLLDAYVSVCHISQFHLYVQGLLLLILSLSCLEVSLLAPLNYHHSSQKSHDEKDK